MSFWTITETLHPCGTGGWVWQDHSGDKLFFIFRLRGRSHDAVHFESQRSNDEDNASIISVDMRKDPGYSTTWGPIGFSRLHHPIHLMVSAHQTLQKKGRNANIIVSQSTCVLVHVCCACTPCNVPDLQRSKLQCVLCVYVLPFVTR